MCALDNSCSYGFKGKQWQYFNARIQNGDQATIKNQNKIIGPSDLL